MYECVDIAMESIPGSQNHNISTILKLTAMGWPVLHTIHIKSLVVLCVVSSSFINCYASCKMHSFRLDVVSILCMVVSYSFNLELQSC
jgi:hypothetical protein